MADEPKKGAKALYGKPPKIQSAEAKGDTPKDAGAPKQAAAKAAETAGSPKTEAVVEGDMKSGTEAKGDVMAGTDGIMTHHTQSGERMEGHHRRMHEHGEMMHRHEREHVMRATGHHAESHEDMAKRHHGEMRAMHTRHERDHKEMGERHAGMAPSGGIEAKPVSDSGTQPT